MKKQMILPNDILSFNKLFKAAGKDLYVVGGAVRDFIKNIEPHDFDLVTNALPDETIQILSKFKTDLQGKHFGVIRVFTTDCKEGYEIASYRKDISKGRDNKSDSKKVELSDKITLNDDCIRRDLTINALYYDIDNNIIIDNVNGISDIENNIINCVGEPILRFNEDRLRILRTIRFAARYEAKIGQKTHDALLTDNRLRNISEIDDVSQERIIDEFKKMIDYSIKQKNFNLSIIYLKYLINYNLLTEMFPGLEFDVNYKSYQKVQNYDILYYIILYSLFSNFIENPDFKNKFIFNFKFSLKDYNNLYFMYMFNKHSKDYTKFYYLKKLQLKFNIESEYISNISNSFDIDTKFTLNFINFKFSINGNDLLENGFKTIELSKEIERLENNLFKELMTK
jgi:tRNA nucleotidyltransferase/poly(A) polymerase